MSSNGIRGGRRLKVAFASAIAACAVGAVGVSSASAATITLDHGFLKISGLEDPQEIVDSVTGPVQLNNVTYSGVTTGTFTTSVANVDFPTFEGTASGVPLIVDVNPLEPLNGNLPAGGQLAFTESDFEAVIALGAPVNSTCRIAPIPLTLVTADNTVFRGDVFDPDTNDSPLNGAITDDWASLPPPTIVAGTTCALIQGLTSGPGGLWLSNGISTPTLVTQPTTPTTPTTPAKKKKKCKKKKKKKKKSASSAAKCKKKKKKKKK
jgi:hypothetical protein